MPIPVILAGAVAKVALGPVVKAAVAKAVTKVADSPYIPEVNKADAAPVATAIIEALGQDAQFQNATNSERPIQSRVVVGSSTAIVGALGILVPIAAQAIGVKIDTPRVVEIVSAVLVLWGPLYALYGRLWSGLKPLFSRKA